MNEITPRVLIDNIDVEYTEGTYVLNGGLTAATLQFKISTLQENYRKFWNKEVLFFLDKHDTIPMFRGYIKRVKEELDYLEIFAQDALGYMVKGGNKEMAKVALDTDNNLDGNTASGAIKLAIAKALLSDKVKTDIIGDTTPLVSSSRPPLRGTLSLLDIIKELLSRAIDNTVEPPRQNIIKIVDDGDNSQLVIEQEVDVETAPIQKVFTEYDNITKIKIINKKIPTIIIVNGKGNVKGTFSHDSAIVAYDRNFLEVTNTALESPAACKDFAQKLFRANLINQYEYALETFDGLYLSENDVIRVETKDAKFTGNYRVRGKKITFTPTSFSIGLNINRKPPTLAEYIARQDN